MKMKHGRTFNKCIILSCDPFFFHSFDSKRAVILVGHVYQYYFKTLNYAFTQFT